MIRTIYKILTGKYIFIDMEIKNAEYSVNFESNMTPRERTAALSTLANYMDGEITEKNVHKNLVKTLAELNIELTSHN